MANSIEDDINEIKEFRERIRTEIGDAHQAILKLISDRVRKYEAELFDSVPVLAGFVIINQWRAEDEILRNLLFVKQAELSKLEGETDVV